METPRMRHQSRRGCASNTLSSARSRFRCSRLLLSQRFSMIGFALPWRRSCSWIVIDKNSSESRARHVQKQNAGRAIWLSGALPSEVLAVWPGQSLPRSGTVPSLERLCTGGLTPGFWHDHITRNRPKSKFRKSQQGTTRFTAARSTPLVARLSQNCRLTRFNGAAPPSHSRPALCQRDDLGRHRSITRFVSSA